MIDFYKILIAGGSAGLVWFLLGAILYMNPWVGRLYRKHMESSGVKKIKDQKRQMLAILFFGCLLQAVIFAFVYANFVPFFKFNLLQATAFFGIVILSMRNLPKAIDMWLFSSYPKALIHIELMNATLSGFVLAFIYALILG